MVNRESFNLIARVLRETAGVDKESRRAFVLAFSEACARANPAFDAERFARACLACPRCHRSEVDA